MTEPEGFEEVFEEIADGEPPRESVIHDKMNEQVRRPSHQIMPDRAERSKPDGSALLRGNWHPGASNLALDKRRQTAALQKRPLKNLTTGGTPVPQLRVISAPPSGRASRRCGRGRPEDRPC